MVKTTICLALLSSLFSLDVLTHRERGYEIGDLANDFRLRNVNGADFSLKDIQSAKGFILVFHCNTCPISRAYDNRIIALSSRYASRGYPLIAINPNAGVSPGDSFEKMVNQAKRKKYDFPYLADEDQEVAKAFGATVTPHVFVLRRKGPDLIVAYIGTIDDNSRNAGAVNVRYVEDAVDALLTGKKVPVAKTKAIGCGIKWRDA
jgi:peroxiredoxin